MNWLCRGTQGCEDAGLCPEGWEFIYPLFLYFPATSSPSFLKHKSFPAGFSSTWSRCLLPFHCPSKQEKPLMFTQGNGGDLVLQTAGKWEKTPVWNRNLCLRSRTSLSPSCDRTELLCTPWDLQLYQMRFNFSGELLGDFFEISLERNFTVFL